MKKLKLSKIKLSKVKIYYIVSVVLLLGVTVFTCVKFYNEFIKKEERPVEERENLDALELYGYTLDDKDTELYKSYFEELKEVLNEEEVDEERYATLLSELFVVDVYTLSNKLTSTDIGGLEFVHVDMVENFKINLGDTMYNHIENNIYGERSQKLPTVSEVSTSKIEATTYTYNKKEYEGYKVSLTWKYEADMGYESSATLILINDNNKLNVVEKVSG